MLIVSILNLFWEAMQLPLYTIWTTGTVGEIVFAVLHCTVGDMMIATFSLASALLVGGARQWPAGRFKSVAAAAIAFGLGYTVFSEWRNTAVTFSWTYSAAMPRLFGIGLSPLLQWLVIPGSAFWWIDRRSRRAG